MDRKPICVLIYSAKFREILNAIKDNRIATYLIRAENDQRFKFTFSYIDVTQDPKKISYISSINNLFAKNKWEDSKRDYMEIDDFIRKTTGIYDQHLLSNFKNLYINAYNDLVLQTPKFKKGDKVELLGNYTNPQTGSVGEIIQVYSKRSTVGYLVQFNGKQYQIHESELKLSHKNYQKNEREIVQKLISDTKDNKIIWECGSLEVRSNSTKYTTRKDITKDKYLSIQLFLYKSRSPNLYFDLKRNNENKYTAIKSIFNQDLNYDLLAAILVQIEKNNKK